MSFDTPQKLRDEISKIEKQITTLEAERAKHEQALCKFFAEFKVGDVVENAKNKRSHRYKITGLRLGFGATDVRYHGVRLRKDNVTPIANCRPTWIYFNKMRKVNS